MTLPTFLVAGAGRCGTTGLVEGLRTHPDVFVTEPKEPHYFGLHGARPAFTAPGDDATINRVAVTDRDAYLRLYPSEHDFAALGDGSVSTLYYHERAIPEILALCPDVRVVVMLREPVARAHSAFQYMSARGFEPCTRLLDAVADEDHRVAQGWHHLWHYTGMSRYAEAVAAFQRALGPDRVGIWFHDDMETDYTRLVSEVLRFIGVVEHVTEGLGVPVVNRSGTPRSHTVQRVIHAATRNESLRRSVKQLTSYRTRERVRNRLLRRTGVPTADRAALEPLFADDLRRLATLVPSDRSPSWLIARAVAND